MVTLPTRRDGSWTGRDLAYLPVEVKNRPVRRQRYSPFSSILPYVANEQTNAAAAAAARDRARTAVPGEREAGDALLHKVLVQLFGAQVAATLCWHSWRSGLCCALHAAGCSDAMIQVICRWASSESLEVYRRLNADRSETVLVDTVRTANMPIVDNADTFAAINSDLSGVAGRAAVQAAAREAAAPVGAGPPLPQPVAKKRARADAQSCARLSAGDLVPRPDPRFLARANAAGRRVLVPATLRPDYECNEHDGAGWTGRVARVTKDCTATVSLVYTHTKSDRRYEPARLHLAAIKPL
jgi:hypothetical protein